MRETGEVRKGLSGDEEAAAPYIGQARTLLGVLKNQMRLGGLAQLSRTVLLPDGTTISVSSRFGQDTIRIDAAAGTTAAAPAEVPNEPFTPPEAAIPTLDLTQPLTSLPTAVGAVYPPAGGRSYAALWKHGKFQQLVEPSGTTSSQALDISTDGRVIVGTYTDGTGAHAFRWTAADGMALLDSAGIGQAAATGTNNDGSIVVGYGNQSGVGDVLWRWSAATGMVVLDSNGLSAVSGTLLKVSPNGAYIVGRVYVSAYTDIAPCVWSGSAASLIAGPVAGTTSYLDSQYAGFVGDTSQDYLVPVDVNNSGQVALYSTHSDGEFVTTTITYYDSSTGLPIGSGSQTDFIVSPYQANDARVWDSVHGGLTLIGDGNPTANGDKALVGNVATNSKVVPYSFQNGGPGVGYQYQITDSYIWTAATPRGWHLNSTGSEVLLPGGGLTTSVTEKGEAIGGWSGTASHPTPVVWVGGAAMAALAITPALPYGRVNALTMD